MLLNRVDLPEDGKLRSGNFYIPRLGQLNAAQQLPVLMSRFVAQYRALFDDEIRIPKRAEVRNLGIWPTIFTSSSSKRRERPGDTNVLRRSLRRELGWT